MSIFQKPISFHVPCIKDLKESGATNKKKIIKYLYGDHAILLNEYIALYTEYDEIKNIVASITKEAPGVVLHMQHINNIDMLRTLHGIRKHLIKPEETDIISDEGIKEIISAESKKFGSVVKDALDSSKIQYTMTLKNMLALAHRWKSVYDTHREENEKHALQIAALNDEITALRIQNEALKKEAEAKDSETVQVGNLPPILKSESDRIKSEHHLALIRAISFSAERTGLKEVTMPCTTADLILYVETMADKICDKNTQYDQLACDIFMWAYSLRLADSKELQPHENCVQLLKEIAKLAQQDPLERPVPVGSTVEHERLLKDALSSAFKKYKSGELKAICVTSLSHNEERMSIDRWNVFLKHHNAHMCGAVSLLQSDVIEKVKSFDSI